MHKYFIETLQYWQYKVFAGIVAAIFTEDFFKLIAVFAMLEILDVFSKMLNLSKKCYNDIYPTMQCGVMRAIGFLWQARKWQYINSTGMRTGVDKILMYLLLLLTGAIVDIAFSIAHTPIQRPLSSVICVVLASTEGLSILENLGCFNNNIGRIKELFKKKCNN